MQDVDADLVALTNNGLLYLFSSLKLTLAGQTVRLHHFSVERAIQQHFQMHVDCHKVGIQVTTIIMDLIQNRAT